MGACHEGDGTASELLSRGGLTAPSVEGKFEMRIASMDDGNGLTWARRSYHVRTPDGVKDLITDEHFDLDYGTYVRAWGEHEDGYAFSLDELEVLAPPPVALIDPEPYEYRRIATVLVFWNQEEISNAAAKDSMFIADNSTNVFYGENSYGKETIAGDVFGPYQIDDPGACNPSLIADRGMQRFIEEGHDPDEYYQFMWHFPGLGDCGFGGLASVGSVEFPAQDSWYNGNFGCVVRAQEIGHNYGMGHSHSYDCPNGVVVPAGEECEHVEYGDPFDPMGSGCRHMNVTQKAYMGWLEGCNIVTTEASGTFNLLPTELPCNGTQALRFPAGDGRWWYLEYRQSYGVDAGFDSVLVHLSNTHEPGPSPYIIEAGQDGYEMVAGDVFTDPNGTASFEVVDMLATHAVIEVTLPGGTGEPTCDDGSAPEMAGGNVGSLECDDEPFPLDIAPPTVVITYPEDGQQFPTGADFTITAEAMDDRYVTEAELYLQIIGTDDMAQPLFKLFDPPYEYDVTNIPEGEYLFGFVVRDGPNEGVSAPVTIRVGDFPADTSGGNDSGDESTSDVDPTDADSGDSNDDDEADTGQDESSSDGVNQSPKAEGCACDVDRGAGPIGWGFGFTLLGVAIGWRSRRRS